MLVALSYVVGSILFLAGSVLFHPHYSVQMSLYKLGAVLFVVGSALFLLPALYDWKTNYNRLVQYDASAAYINSITSASSNPPSGGRPTTIQNISIFATPPPTIPNDTTVASTSPLLLHRSEYSINSEDERGRGVEGGQALALHPPYVLANHAVAMTRSTISVVNGILFTLGSVVYWPGYGHSGIVAGNWLYRMGSSMTMISSTWALVRLFGRTHYSPKVLYMLRAYSAQMFLGGLCYFIGGIYFIHHVGDVGAVLWIVGSTFFITSSAMLFWM